MRDAVRHPDIDNEFHSLPASETLTRRAEQPRAGFVYAVKASKLLRQLRGRRIGVEELGASSYA